MGQVTNDGPGGNITGLKIRVWGLNNGEVVLLIKVGRRV